MMAILVYGLASGRRDSRCFCARFRVFVKELATVIAVNCSFECDCVFCIDFYIYI